MSESRENQENLHEKDFFPGIYFDYSALQNAVPNISGLIDKTKEVQTVNHELIPEYFDELSFLHASDAWKRELKFFPNGEISIAGLSFFEAFSEELQGIQKRSSIKMDADFLYMMNSYKCSSDSTNVGNTVNLTLTAMRKIPGVLRQIKHVVAAEKWDDLLDPEREKKFVNNGPVSLEFLYMLQRKVAVNGHLEYVKTIDYWIYHLSNTESTYSRLLRVNSAIAQMLNALGYKTAAESWGNTISDLSRIISEIRAQVGPAKTGETPLAESRPAYSPDEASVVVDPDLLDEPTEPVNVESAEFPRVKTSPLHLIPKK